MSDRKCPDCGGKLRIRTSKRVGSVDEKRRECTACDYRDVAYYEPAKFLRLSVVPTTSQTPPNSQHRE